MKRNMGRYDDIIWLSRPKRKREPMKIADRAKIFMPFSALKGYEEALEEKEKQLTVRVELSEERKAELNDRLRRIEELCAGKEKPEITVTFFQPEKKVSSQNVSAKQVSKNEGSRNVPLKNEGFRNEEFKNEVFDNEGFRNDAFKNEVFKDEAFRKSEEVGSYVELTGVCTKVDATYERIYLGDKKICFRDILDIKTS